ncbi:MAG: 2-oxo-4-hydroxy-4-carboxy-5-ureidoimidazoline decarboxylase [Micromonosporaceae bacterium]|jgi:2-oxo-4-hydroxy-4-carboxy-5-ureidoimidazoline decarboxylase|nr:2-oxo-4-hydroxy-4-carboxy-5-ureidoimidazoline decarboxylase [Micromonosporaceae bacterium]
MTDAGLARFNGFPAEPTDRGEPAEQARQIGEQVRACCASSVWVAAILGGRPYARRADLLSCSDEVLASLDWADVLQALDAHPRIGERVAGTGQEATWSRREQSGMDHAPQDVRVALLDANRAYEERFGHVFLIFATGRTDVEMLAAARDRVGNDEATERLVVRSELGRIVARRLTVLLDSWGAER